MDTGGGSRLFLALWPGDDTQAELARCRDAWVWGPAARPEPTDRLHLTLHFIGAVPARRLPDLMGGLELSFAEFGLCLDRVQLWPTGVAALTPRAVPHDLLSLHAALGRKLERLELPSENRHYRPHVTLARRAAGSTAPGQVSPVPWQVRDYALIESRSAPREYVVLRHFR
jgi:RNA 2',3'-cyclic 3'-phosphodiesterase